eukprot:TRINITY_DN39617_c0_g1_i2.p1 TRINITY_DN39617_c0_g1~~TRINITY_DN39617_c0_g1_i2.p1  ORF type:complete len:529 (+),score=90.67 TRINITY_DN39617_c0_g1_i2:93-1679(+)
MEGDRRYLSGLKAAALKALCKEEGLATSGSKGDIVERIIEHRERRMQLGQTASKTVGTASAAAGAGVGASGSASAAHAEGDGTGSSTASTAPAKAAASSSSGAPPKPAAKAGRGRGRGRGRGGTKAAGTVNGRGSGLHVGPDERLVHCSKCDSDCAVPNNINAPPGFWCPTCRFQVMDPFNPLAEPHGILTYKFLQSLQLTLTLELLDLREWMKNGFTVEVRMVRTESDRVCHAWPQSLHCAVNNVEVFSISPPEEGHKRRDVPQQLTAGLRPGKNVVRLKMVDPCITEFALAVVVCCPQTVDALSGLVGRSSMQEAERRVRDLLAARNAMTDSCSSEITCLTSHKLSLRCPITMDRLQEPVRGEGCQHLQCFGLLAYLQSNKQMRAFNNRWVCPVCSLVLRPTDLRRDAYVEKVLASTGLDVEDVGVLPDAAWRLPDNAKAKSGGVQPGSPNGAEAFDLEDDSAEATTQADSPAMTEAAQQPSESRGSAETEVDDTVQCPGPRPPKRFKAGVIMPNSEIDLDSSQGK